MGSPKSIFFPPNNNLRDDLEDVKLVESIRVMNGRFSRLSLHEDRLNHTRKMLFSATNTLCLKRKILIPEPYQKGLVKCRLIYSKDIEEISFSHYEIRKINRIKIVTCDTISYSFKYLERTTLDNLFEQKTNCDEIMIIKNGQVTDAYYYNYVFQKGHEYFTPTEPLLEGVMRSSLINAQKIIKRDIFAAEIHQFDAIHLINALTPLGKVVIKPNQIIH